MTPLRQIRNPSICSFVVLCRVIGIYIRVLTGISKKVLPQFFLVFIIALLAWSGAFYPSLRSHLIEQHNDSRKAVEKTDIGRIREFE